MSIERAPGLKQREHGHHREQPQNRTFKGNPTQHGERQRPGPQYCAKEVDPTLSPQSDQTHTRVRRMRRLDDTFGAPTGQGLNKAPEVCQVSVIEQVKSP